MNSKVTYLRGIWFAGLLLTAGGYDCVAADELAQPVSVVLKEKAICTRRVVLLGDIAFLNGGPDSMLQRLSEVEIDELPADGKAKTATRLQIQFCLRLAGFPANSFELAGATDVVISPRRQSLNADDLFRAAKEEALRRLPWPKDSVSVRLMQPITVPLPKVAEGETLELRAEPHQSAFTFGRVQMNVTIKINGERRLALAVYLEILPIQEVLLARRTIARGETLGENDMVRERRPLDPKDTRYARPSDVIGKKARRDLPQGSTLQKTDVEFSDGDGAIQAGQTVRLVAKLGSMDVVVLAEAMQAGTQGQSIRVRNRESQKVVVGRVTGPKTVEVDFGNP